MLFPGLSWSAFVLDYCQQSSWVQQHELYTFGGFLWFLAAHQEDITYHISIRPCHCGQICPGPEMLDWAVCIEFQSSRLWSSLSLSAKFEGNLTSFQLLKAFFSLIQKAFSALAGIGSSHWSGLGIHIQHSTFSVSHLSCFGCANSLRFSLWMS